MTPRQRATYTLKLALSHALYYTGLLGLWQSVAMRNKAVVLMYHRVLTADERRRSGSHPALVVDRETFARQMAVLKRRFNVLSIEEFADCLERRVPFPPSSCVITFDDGWRDNFTNALPILRQHSLPALVFLPVNYVGRNRLFWQEALTHLLLQVVAEVTRNPERRQALEEMLRPSGLAGVLDVTDEDARPAIRAAVGSQKALTRSATEALIASLARELGVSLAALSEVDGFVDWRQVEQMSGQRIAFGAHGVEHLLLTHISEDEAECEIRTSGQVVANRVGPRVLTFSYPNGYHTPAIVNRVKAAGYRLAFITTRGFVTCDDDPFTLRRLNVHEGVTATTPMFLARIVGLM
jgi:peptidoglycan/xylan/chitin deacetylase (PgdA/CDA1 family)